MRKMLVEEYLVAVVSLPAGVFNPYSGVKTSILILDKALARRTDRIAFFKVEADGYDLGAQRRAVDRNDLPQTLAELTEYLGHLRAGESVDDFTPDKGLVVVKDKVAEDGDFNLSGERYREVVAAESSYPLVPAGTFYRNAVKSRDPRLSPEDTFELWSIPAFDNNCPEIRKGAEIGSPKKIVRRGDVLLSRIIPHIRRAWVVQESRDRFCQLASTEWIIFSSEQIVPEFLKRIVRSDPFHAQFMQTITGVGGSLSRANPKAVANIRIPFPPLEVQQEIVAEIEGYQRVIDGARAVVDNYRPHIAVDPEWPVVPVHTLAHPEYGFTASAEDHGDARFIRITDITQEGSLSSKDPKFVTSNNKSKKSILARGDILISRTGATYGKTMVFDETYTAVFASYLIRLRFPPDVVDPYFYWAFAQSDNYWNQAKALVTGGGQPQFNGNAIKHIKLPLPPLATQHAIVGELETEQALVSANRQLIQLMEGKVTAAVERVWDG